MLSTRPTNSTSNVSPKEPKDTSSQAPRSLFHISKSAATKPKSILRSSSRYGSAPRLQEEEKTTDSTLIRLQKAKTNYEDSLKQCDIIQQQLDGLYAQLPELEQKISDYTSRLDNIFETRLSSNKVTSKDVINDKTTNVLYTLRSKETCTLNEIKTQNQIYSAVYKAH